MITTEDWYSRVRTVPSEFPGGHVSEEERLMRWLYYYGGDAEIEARQLLHARFIDAQAAEAVLK